MSSKTIELNGDLFAKNKCDRIMMRYYNGNIISFRLWGSRYMKSKNNETDEFVKRFNDSIIQDNDIVNSLETVGDALPLFIDADIIDVDNGVEYRDLCSIIVTSKEIVIRDMEIMDLLSECCSEEICITPLTTGNIEMLITINLEKRGLS